MIDTYQSTALHSTMFLLNLNDLTRGKKIIVDFTFHDVSIKSPSLFRPLYITSILPLFVYPVTSSIIIVILFLFLLTAFYHSLIFCILTAFLPVCRPTGIFALSEVDSHNRKLVISSSFPQNSLSNHRSCRDLNTITESRSLSTYCFSSWCSWASCTFVISPSNTES